MVFELKPSHETVLYCISTLLRLSTYTIFRKTEKSNEQQKKYVSRALRIMWQVAVGIWFSYYPAYFLRRRRVKDNNSSKNCTQALSSSAVKDVRIELSNLFGLFTPINCRKLHHLSLLLKNETFLFLLFCEMYGAIK